MMFEPGSDDDSDFDTPTGSRQPATLASIFNSDQRAQKTSSTRTHLLKYQAPKQPGSKPPSGSSQAEEILKNSEKNRQDEAEFEPMCNVRPGVKMATAVTAYKNENGGFKSVGKLGLAIIGNKDSNFYQMLMYRGKQQPVAVVNITLAMVFNVQPGNYANFVDDKQNNWTVCFDSHDLLVNVCKQVMLCKTVFKMENEISCDISQGEGKALEDGDSVEVKMTGWTVENQSIGPMFETTSGKGKAMRFKIGAKKLSQWLEAGVLGMKKGGRRFIIIPSNMTSGAVESRTPKNTILAYDIEVTKTKSAEMHLPQQSHEVQKQGPSTERQKQDMIQRMAKMGQPMIPILPQINNSNDNLTPDLPELEEVNNYPATSHDVDSKQFHHQYGSTASLARPETPQSMQSFTSTTSYEKRQSDPVTVRTGYGEQQGWRQQPLGGYTPSSSDWNLLMSETRLQNTEMRMSMQRVSDKVEQILTNQMSTQKIPAQSTEDTIKLPVIKSLLDSIKEQNDEIKEHLMQKQTGQANLENTLGPVQSQASHIAKTEQALAKWQEENEAKQSKLEKQTKKLEELETKLREKEIQLEEISRSRGDDIRVLKEKLNEASSLVATTKESARGEIKSDLKKMMGSTAKVLHAQFVPEEVYSGEAVRDVITDTIRQITIKLLEKYSVVTEEQVPSVVKTQPPVATVIPITNYSDEEVTFGDDEWNIDDQ